MPYGSSHLPIEPIAQWLERQCNDEHIVAIPGIPDRTLLRLRRREGADNRPTDRVTLNLVDRILTAAGIPLWELYPDSDEAIAPAFCETCEEDVLPDPDGVCPWCETRTDGGQQQNGRVEIARFARGGLVDLAPFRRWLVEQDFDIADLFGVNPTTVYRWLGGRVSGVREVVVRRGLDRARSRGLSRVRFEDLYPEREMEKAA